jgi:argininosuccinate synthase
VLSNQHFVTGQVRVKMFKGKTKVVSRQSEHRLYSKKLATYESGDLFDHEAAKGVIRL